MARIAIVGPGAVGSVLAALLHSTGRHELLVCARRPLASVTVESAAGNVRLAPAVVTSPADATPVDWVLVCTKAYDSGSAAKWLAPLAGSGAPVAIVQNGVEHRERFAGHVPAEQLVPVMVDCPAERHPDRVVQRGAARLVVADDAHGRAFVELFRGSAAQASTTADLKSAVWRKLCLNAVGVISALVDRPAGVIREPEAEQLGRQIIRECLAVARAEGAVLADDVEDAIIAGCRAAPVDGVNSLYADLRAGRPTEIDARNGVIVRLGREHGIPTPYNEMAVRLVSLRQR